MGGAGERLTAGRQFGIVGEHAGAIEVAEGALDLLRESDFADLHGGARVDLAAVYQRAGRREDAIAALRSSPSTTAVCSGALGPRRKPSTRQASAGG